MASLSSQNSCFEVNVEYIISRVDHWYEYARMDCVRMIIEGFCSIVKMMCRSCSHSTGEHRHSNNLHCWPTPIRVTFQPIKANIAMLQNTNTHLHWPHFVVKIEFSLLFC